MNRFVIGIAAVCFMTGRAAGAIVLFQDISAFRDQLGPIENVLYFRTDKTEMESFDSSFKTRPWDYFSDLVTFSSPGSTSPSNVLWSHFDGPDGGIGSSPSLFQPLRIDFVSPVSVVGFRNRGLQPGISVHYYDSNDQLVGEVPASASSFVGVSSTIPIGYIIVHEIPPTPLPGQFPQPSFITALHFNSGPVAAVPEPSTNMILAGLVTYMGIAGWRRSRRIQVQREPRFNYLTQGSEKTRC